LDLNLQGLQEGTRAYEEAQGLRVIDVPLSTENWLDLIQDETKRRQRTVDTLIEDTTITGQDQAEDNVLTSTEPAERYS
jgi:hypothetical protein